ncbi:hypothetical protein DQP55_07380 [Mycolicibacterium sp. GF69]|uniref:hypothetical protein n=1 Tax=Mycolicibacterium sp. GF69 TaxID=2267251 RepID=UPI000DCC9EE1|nr:hypothetical protein [Mycolicibacterium sp. GF69]RAV15175.1 hypothetical protein DQP55_07380 [Mycolicibacterium sp. GF69]
MSRRTVARASISAISTILFFLPALLAGPVLGPAFAQPDDPGPPDVTLTWSTLGLESQTYLSPNSATSFAVPVPAGLKAVRLQGVMHAPMNIDGGYLEINDGGGRVLAAVDLPPATSDRAVTPLDVDISAARTRGSTVDLSFTLRTRETGDRFCGPLQQLFISDLAAVFAGAESPATTVANFFPPVLERVVIYAPADADAAEQESVLTVASALTRLYHPAPLSVSVETLNRGAAPAPAGQLTRAVVVERGGSAGIRIENPGSPNVYLRFAGDGDELSTQVSLLIDDLQKLVQTATARINQAGSNTTPDGDVLTFSQLGMSGKTDVLRIGRLTVGVDRAALGTGRVESVQVHLLADYTPVPRDDAASVIIRSDGAVVYRTALDNSGVLDATFDLPSQTFSQWVNLDFTFTYTPHEMCGPLIVPITFQVDPRSTLTMRRGGPPLGGFGAVPSEFSPGFMVALDGSSPDQLSYATRVVTAIARLTGQPLTPQVVELGVAADSETGALIVARSAAIAETSLNPPIGGDGKAVDVGLQTELRADIDGGLGSIQAFADRPRNRSVVLVTTTDAWSLVDPLFAYLDGQDGGWSALTGDVLAAGAAGVPTNVTIRAQADVYETPNPHTMNRWVVVGAGVATAVAVLAVAVVVLSRRRRPPGARTAD